MEGIYTELSELIALKRWAKSTSHSSKSPVIYQGNYQSSLRGRGMDFAEARNYQAGDEIRHMEWRVTARTGKPHVKVYQEEKERPVIVLTVFSPSLYFGTRMALKSVVAARLSALIAWTVSKQGDRIGALFSSLLHHEEFTPKARERAVLPLLKSLCDFTQSFPNSNVEDSPLLSDALLRLQRIKKPGSLLILISDFYHFDMECEKRLRFMRKHHDILAYQIADPLEINAPKAGRYAMTDGKQEFLLDTSNYSIAKSYQSFCDERQETLKRQFKALQIPLHQVTPFQELFLIIKQTFPRCMYG